MDTTYVEEFLHKFSPLFTREVALKIQDCLAFIPSNKQQEFVDNLIRSNPAVILKLRRNDPPFSAYTFESIISIALSDTDKIAFAPRSLAEFFKNTPKVRDEAMLLSMLKDVSDIYSYINRTFALGNQSMINWISGDKETIY